MTVVTVSPLALQAESKGAFPTFFDAYAERLNSPAEKILKLDLTFKGKEGDNHPLKK